MYKRKVLAIWMDDASAHYMELINGTLVKNSISANNKYQMKIENPVVDFMRLCFKQSDYYKQIGDIILGFEEVVLFGPSGPKNELMHLLLLNHLFDRINLSIKYAEIMDEQVMEMRVRSMGRRSGHLPSSFQKRTSNYIEFESFGYFTSIL